MAEEFQGGVCGDTWWNPNLFYGSGGGKTQLGGGYDIGGFGWPHEIVKGKSNNNNNNQVCDDNPLVFSATFDSTLDILGFGLSPTSSITNWNQQNHFCKIGTNEENFDSMLQDNLSTSLNYELGANISTMMNSSNSPGNSSTITQDEGGLATSFPMSSSTSYLIQTLFDDVDDQSQLISTNDFGVDELMTSHSSWTKSSIINTPSVQPSLTPPSSLEMIQVSNESNIQASLLNSLQSRSRSPSFNNKSLECSSYATKLKDLKREEARQETKKNMNNEQPTAKRPRIETPSPLPTFKVRKEKLGDRITALQQLVSPFGKTDTASVLQEAIEYIKFLHNQVHVLTTPYLKNGDTEQHQLAIMNENEEIKQNLRSRGLCVVPISSTYPVTQETPVDFWTPTFGGTTLSR